MAKKKAAAAAGAVAAAKDNPYVQRIVSDDDLRDNVRVAFDAAKSAYERLSNGKAPSKALMDDKKLHKDLKEAAEALRDAGGAGLLAFGENEGTVPSFSPATLAGRPATIAPWRPQPPRIRSSTRCA